MSVFCGFQRFFRWIICAPLVVVCVEGAANAADPDLNSCVVGLYRAYDNTDDSYLSYINLSDGVNFGTVTYTGGQAWPATGLTAAPTYNGYTFDGFYLREIQQYSSSMSSVINAPAQCIEGGLLAHWSFNGCNADVVLGNSDYGYPSPILINQNSVGTVMSTTAPEWEVRFLDEHTRDIIIGTSSCTSIPGGYDSVFGFSTAAYNTISAGGSGKYCWCRATNNGQDSNGSSQINSNNVNAYTQWVWVELRVARCTQNICSSACATMLAGNSSQENEDFRAAIYGHNCPFKINYSDVIGINSNPDRYTYGDSAITLANPTSFNSNVVFDRWTDDDNNDATVTSIPSGSRGTKNFTANYLCATGYSEKSCPLAGLDNTIDSTAYESVAINTSPYGVEGEDLFPGEWLAKYSYGVVRGNAACSTTSGSPVNQLFISSTVGPYCWCKPTLFSDNGSFESGHAAGVGTAPWYISSYSGTHSSANCQASCANACAKQAALDSETRNVWYKCTAGCQPNVCFVNYYNVLNGNETWPNPKMTPTLFSAETPVASFTVSNPNRPTHAFVSWCENAGLSTNCSGTKTIATNSCTTDQSAINLYAKWNQLYTLSYACDNGATPPSSTNVAPGNVLLADKDAACGGHTSCETVRWNCVDANNNNVNVVNVQGHSGLTMPAANVTCTLVRNTISYEIGVEGNGGSGELRVNGSGLLIPQDNSFQCQCGTTVTLPEWGLNNTLTQNGKVFIGWADYDTGNAITEPFNCADTKVVATWCDCVQNCTAGSNSASCSYTGVANNSCGYNYSCSTGYNNNGVTSGTYYAASGTCPSTVSGPSCSGNEIVLQWYNQNIQLNNEPQSCIYGTPYSAATGAISTIVPPTRQGYDFAGWTVTGYQP